MNTKEISHIYKTFDNTDDSLENRMVISVVIRVRNAANDLQHCLNLLQQQDLPKGAELEIIVVDNESTDHSAQVAEKYGAKVVNITVREFTWGRALNQGIAASLGIFILLLSADAYPADNKWIVEMISPLQKLGISVVYGRQIPRADAPIDEIVRLRKTFPEKSIKFDLQSIKHTDRVLIASNACAAFPRKIWEHYPFDEIIDGAEDQLWIQKVVNADHKSMYSSSAVVFHSHNDTLLRNACRLVELWKESCIQKKQTFRITCFIKLILIYSKKRLLNIIFTNNFFFKRFEGIIRLPFEIIAMFVVYLSIPLGLIKKLRYYAWKQ